MIPGRDWADCFSILHGANRSQAELLTMQSNRLRASEGNRTLVTSLGSWGNAIIRRSRDVDRPKDIIPRAPWRGKTPARPLRDALTSPFPLPVILTLPLLRVTGEVRSGVIKARHPYRSFRSWLLNRPA